jgi:hypothetical protein
MGRRGRALSKLLCPDLAGLGPSDGGLYLWFKISYWECRFRGLIKLLIGDEDWVLYGKCCASLSFVKMVLLLGSTQKSRLAVFPGRSWTSREFGCSFKVLGPGAVLSRVVEMGRNEERLRIGEEREVGLNWAITLFLGWV